MRHRTWSLALALALLLPNAAAAQSASLNFSAADRGQQELFEAATPQMRMSSYLSSMKNAAPVPIEDEQPIGYFARRLVTGCNTCHVAFPKLNTYGRLVKNMGYELPELDLNELHEPALKKVTRYIPLAFRGVLDLTNGDPNDLNGQFNVRALQMLSRAGGTAWGNRLSWWAHTHIVEENEFVNPWTRKASADDGGKAELAENVDEHGLGKLDRRGIQPPALEQESTEAVLDGEGIAVAAVEHLELPFEVDGPDRVGLIHGRERLAGVARFTRTPTLLRDQIVTLENVINRPASWCLAELLSCEFADLA